MAASIAANTRWAKEPDRRGATSAARAAFDKRFEDEVDAECVLPPELRAKKVKAARQAYFMRLALKSAQSRKKVQAGGPDAA
jgi:hypothetical protein